MFGLLNTSAELDNTEWTLCVIPDTQRLAPNNPTAYNTMMQWVVDNYATENMEMVIHLGDYVNSAGSSSEWSAVDTAVNRFHTNNIPFIHCAGNWDYDAGNTDTTRSTSSYWEPTFPASDWSSYDWYVDEYNGVTTNQAAVKTIGNYRYLFLTLEVWPRAAVLTWADDIIKSQGVDRIILGTHALTRPDGSYEPYGEGNEGGGQGGGPDDYGFCDSSSSTKCSSGVELYDNFISNHKNMILVCNGHDVKTQNNAIGEGTPNETAYSTRTDTVDGKTINTHLFNYQNDSSNNYADAAYLRLYRFNHLTHTCSIETYNPVQDTNLTDGENQFTFNYA